MNAARTLDMSEGRIAGKLLRFALPIMLGQLLQELYNVADMVIVGRALGVTELAAVGATGSAIFLVTGFASGLSYGAAVLTAQRFGAGDEAGVKTSVAAHFIIAAISSAALALGFALAAGPLMRLLRTTPDTFLHARLYLTIIYAGLPAFMLYTMLASLLRAVGDSRTPLLFLILSSLLNIALDLLCVCVCGWGVAGAAIATVLAQLVSGLLCLWVILRRAPLLLPDKASLRSGLGAAIAEELKVGVPMGFQFSITAIGLMVLQGVLNGFGSDAVAAYTVGSRVQSLMYCPLGAMSAVMATFTAQNAGAGQFARVRAGVRMSLWGSLLLSCAIALAFWLLRVPVIRLFVGENGDAVVPLAEEFMRWCCPLLWSLGALFVYRGALQGLGDGLSTMLGGAMELIMRTAIPLLFATALGYRAVCIAGPAAWLACAALLFIIYRRRMRRPEYA